MLLSLAWLQEQRNLLVVERRRPRTCRLRKYSDYRVPPPNPRLKLPGGHDSIGLIVSCNQQID